MKGRSALMFWVICFIHPIFDFLVLVTFGDKVTKILCNLCLHFERRDGQDRKKWKKITQLKWPKYQKPEGENMEWMKNENVFLSPLKNQKQKSFTSKITSLLFLWQINRTRLIFLLKLASVLQQTRPQCSWTLLTLDLWQSKGTLEDIIPRNWFEFYFSKIPLTEL